jgi:hypothetical protein
MEQRGDAVIAALLDDLIEALESGPGPQYSFQTTVND